MKYLMLLTVLTSCGSITRAMNEQNKPKVIYKTITTTIPTTERKLECIKTFYTLGMKSEEAISACTFIEHR